MPNELDPTTTDDLQTPALVVESSIFDANCAAMDAVLPGNKLRPHVKAFKSTAMARRLADGGHTGFCAATPLEIEGMVRAGRWLTTPTSPLRSTQTPHSTQPSPEGSEAC